MAYIVNDEIPKCCNKCPFGVLRYSTPLSTNKHGYNCNLDFKANGRYTKTVENDCEWDIEKPSWCPLSDTKELYQELDKKSFTVDMGQNETRAVRLVDVEDLLLNKNLR